MFALWLFGSLLAGTLGVGVRILVGANATAARRLRARLASASAAHGIRHWRSRGPTTSVAEAGDFRIHVDLSTETVARDRPMLLQALAPESSGDVIPYLRVTVSGGRIPRDLSFGPKQDGRDDVLVGDPLFDDNVGIRGEPGVVLALLDQRLRGKVRDLVAAGGSLTDATLVWWAPYTLLERDFRLAVEMLLELADALATTDSGGVCERLARNAVGDSVGGVRLWNLLQLQERFSAAPEARAASVAGLGDADPWVRLSAARFVTDESLPVLERLASERATPEPAAAEAIALLAARMPTELAGPLLVRLLKSRTGDARRQAAAELGRLGYLPALGPLIVVLEHSSAAAASAAAVALGRLGDVKAEPALLAAVSGNAPELRVPAAHALGRIGSSASVEPLLRLLADGSRGEAAASVRQAIAAIQSRLACAEAGQLSLADGGAQAGHLSVARPGAGIGAVSLDSRSPPGSKLDRP
jgi:HEAT repeat protein